MIVVLENAVDKEIQDTIESCICSSEFPWFYTSEITGGSKFGETDPYGGFFNIVRFYGQANNHYNDLFLEILRSVVNNTNLQVFNVDRIRAGMFTREKEIIIHSPHIDYDVPHTAMLYYVCDSDGPTFFYNDQKEIIKTVEPKKGTVVLFDGSTLHSSSSPCISARRIVLNYNFNVNCPVQNNIQLVQSQ
jgi:hypothetical protein